MNIQTEKLGLIEWISFNAQDFLNKHPQYDWMNGLIKDRPAQPWTLFKAGETE